MPGPGPGPGPGLSLGEVGQARPRVSRQASHRLAQSQPHGAWWGAVGWGSHATAHFVIPLESRTSGSRFQHGSMKGQRRQGRAGQGRAGHRPLARKRGWYERPWNTSYYYCRARHIRGHPRAIVFYFVFPRNPADPALRTLRPLCDYSATTLRPGQDCSRPTQPGAARRGARFEGIAPETVGV